MLDNPLSVDKDNVDFYSTTQGDVLDLIVLRHYGQCPGQLLCQVFAANHEY